MRSHTKFGPDRFSRFDVYWTQTNRPTSKQTSKVYIYISILLCLLCTLYMNKPIISLFMYTASGFLPRRGSLWFKILPRLGGLYMPKAVITRHYKLLLSSTLNGKTHIMFVNGVVCNLLYPILSQKTGVSRKNKFI